jgi:hypothetical protein
LSLRYVSLKTLSRCHWQQNNTAMTTVGDRR